MKNLLLPCPFCGGETPIVKPVYGQFHRIFYCVLCSVCSGQTKSNYRDTAISQWNRRPK